jgi:hypothetical protein
MGDRKRPEIVVIHRHDDHGCLITVLLLIVAWPLAILYWIVRLIGWILGAVIDWMTFGPLRRGRRR